MSVSNRLVFIETYLYLCTQRDLRIPIITCVIYLLTLSLHSSVVNRYTQTVLSNLQQDPLRPPILCNKLNPKYLTRGVTGCNGHLGVCY